MTGEKSADEYPTLVDVKVAGGSLKVQVFNMVDNKKIAEYKYAPKH